MFAPLVATNYRTSRLRVWEATLQGGPLQTDARILLPLQLKGWFLNTQI